MKPTMKNLRKLEKEALDLVDLAGVYQADGAPATAADRLRQAAAKLDKFAALKAAMIERVCA